MDKRGRPVETTTDENLKRYYNLAEEDEEKLDEEDGEGTSASESSEQSSESEVEGNVKEDAITKPPKVKQKLDEVTRKKLHNNKIDYARGEASFVDQSSSDDDDSSTTDEEDGAPVEHGRFLDYISSAN